MSTTTLRVCNVCGHKTKALDAQFCSDCGATLQEVTNNNGTPSEDTEEIKKMIQLLLHKDTPEHKWQDPEYQKLELYNEKLHNAYHDVLSIKFDNKLFSFPITCSFCGKKIYTKVNKKEVSDKDGVIFDNEEDNTMRIAGGKDQ